MTRQFRSDRFIISTDQPLANGDRTGTVDIETARNAHQGTALLDNPLSFPTPNRIVRQIWTSFLLSCELVVRTNTRFP